MQSVIQILVLRDDDPRVYRPWPTRNEKPGIRSFLDYLVEVYLANWNMLAFIYIAYQMIASLFERVPTLKDIWMDHLRDLDWIALPFKMKIRVSRIARRNMGL